MRASPDETEIPELMRGAWHIDVHVGEICSLLSPSDLVRAVFKTPVTTLDVGDQLETTFGKFYVDDLRSDDTEVHVLLHTWAPRLVSRFAMTVHRNPGGRVRALLHNSVHPDSWIGRAYFRSIELGHHVIMEIALRRLVHVAGRSTALRRTSMSASPGRSFRWEAIAERFSIFAMHRALYRAFGGRLVGRNLLILTTMGRRTGQRRSTLLYYVRDGEDYIVIASNGGDDWYPGWWHNIRANPDVEIEMGRSRIPCKAEPVREADRRPLFAKLTRVYAGYAKYEQRTARELTLFRLRAHSAELRPWMSTTCSVLSA